MSFQLVIAEGKEAGREFVFDQDSIVIGRTPECDVVLYDPGVSRRHARIFSEGEAHFVEDMGSSNGTKVNGAIIKKKQLIDGDAVALGPVVFKYSAMLGDTGEITGKVESEISQGSTRIVSIDDVKRQRNKGVALAPKGADAEALERMARHDTQGMKTLGRVRSGPLPSVSRHRGGLSAAERARIKRESSPVMAKLRLFWGDASAGTRRLILAGFSLAGLAALGLVYYLVIVSGEQVVERPPEPNALSRKPVAFSFGLGEGVDYERPDMKIFDFEFSAPVKAVVIVHYQSKDISQGEVLVSVNGVDVGEVPPDTLAANERSHELTIAPSNLKNGERNQLTFDNTKNPPRSDPWRIWNVWIEVNYLPELPPNELVREATVTFQRGQQNFERREVGARNRYEAWKDFRGAWLMLEAHPEPKPELYDLARDKMREAQNELDQTCGKLMLQARTEYNLKQFDAAKLTLDHVADYFPANDQPCPWVAERQRAALGL